MDAVIGFRSLIRGGACLSKGGISDRGHLRAFLHQHRGAFRERAHRLANSAVQIARDALDGSTARGFHFRPACRFRGTQFFGFN